VAATGSAPRSGEGQSAISVSACPDSQPVHGHWSRQPSVLQQHGRVHRPARGWIPTVFLCAHEGDPAIEATSMPSGLGQAVARSAMPVVLVGRLLVRRANVPGTPALSSSTRAVGHYRTTATRSLRKAMRDHLVEVTREVTGRCSASGHPTRIHCGLSRPPAGTTREQLRPLGDRSASQQREGSPTHRGRRPKERWDCGPGADEPHRGGRTPPVVDCRVR